MQLLRENISQILFRLFNYIGNQELAIERKREDLAKQPKFEPYSAFKRIAIMGDKVGKRDILKFLKQNEQNYPDEDDCKFIIKYYDSDNDGYLSFLDFNYIVLPNDNLELRARATQQNNEYNKEIDRIIEQKLSRLLMMEINFHIQTEKIKRELEQLKGFSTVVAFQVMDVKKFNYLDWESLFGFLKYYAGTQKQDQPTKRKINSIFRRLDVNADQKIAFNEFAEAIKPIDVYFTDIDEINLREVSPRKYSQAELADFKRQLRQEHTEHKSAERTKPLRTFKTILSSKDVRAIKELKSPIKRQKNDIMINKNEQEDQDYSPIRRINQDKPMQLDDLSTVKKDQDLKTSNRIQGSQSTQKVHYYNFNNENSTQKNIRFTSGIKNKLETPIKESPSAQSIRWQQLDQLDSERLQRQQAQQQQDKNNQYSPIASTLKSESKQSQISNTHIKLIPKRLDKPEYNKETPQKAQNSQNSIQNQTISRNNEKSSEKQSISAHKQSQFSIDSYSPEKFAQDVHQIGNVKLEMRINMEQLHKNYPFTRLIHQIHNSLKLIEHEKDLLFSKAQDFNILDAFRAFDIDNKGYISQVELISGLLEMKIEHSQSELNTFFKYYDSEGQKRIRFADFSRAFLPSDKDKSLQILKRDPLNVKVIKKPTLIFLKNTFLQYIVVWRILLRQMWEIDNFKKRYAQANCFDVEKPFFDMDKYRLGKISKDNLKEYMIQKQDEQRYSDQDIDMIFNYFNRRELPQVSFDDFVAEMMVY